jgi:hypothetical protein
MRPILNHIPDALFFVGAMLVIHGMFLVATWLGFVVSGVACIAGALLAAGAERRRSSGRTG